MRESPAIELIKELMAEGAVITAYDPVAMDEARQIFLNTSTMQIGSNLS